MASIEIPKMIQISVFSNCAHDLGIIGLGEDNRVYHWNYQAGQWLPQWNTGVTPEPPKV